MEDSDEHDKVDADGDMDKSETVKMRPAGRKQEKDLMSKKRSLEEATRELIKRQKEIVEISRQKLVAVQELADEAIMSRDTTKMNPVSKAYYVKKQQQILDKLNAQENKENEQPEGNQ